MANSTNNQGLLTQRLKSAFFIASPSEDSKRLRGKKCLSEAMTEGAKSAGIAFVVISVPLLIAARKVPWVKANINYAGQTYIISSGTLYRFVFKVDQKIDECSKKNRQLLSSIKSV